jgi:hypothetical protein
MSPAMSVLFLSRLTTDYSVLVRRLELRTY